MDLPTFLRQNAALAELAMGRVLRRSVTPGETILDASSRFVAQGDCWQPSASLNRKIRRAALGALSCEQAWRRCFISPLVRGLLLALARTAG